MQKPVKVTEGLAANARDLTIHTKTTKEEVTLRPPLHGLKRRPIFIIYWGQGHGLLLFSSKHTRREAAMSKICLCSARERERQFSHLDKYGNVTMLWCTDPESLWWFCFSLAWCDCESQTTHYLKQYIVCLSCPGFSFRAELVDELPGGDQSHSGTLQSLVMAWERSPWASTGRDESLYWISWRSIQ